MAEGTLAEEVLLDVIKPESNEWGRWAPECADMALRGAEAKLIFGAQGRQRPLQRFGAGRQRRGGQCRRRQIDRGGRMREGMRARKVETSIDGVEERGGK